MAKSKEQPARALLLLPPAPNSPSYRCLKAAYEVPLRAVLQESIDSLNRSKKPAVLEIAIPCQHLYGHLNGPRGPLFTTTQQLVANVYKIICCQLSKESIHNEIAERIDARIILVAYSRDDHSLSNRSLSNLSLSISDQDQQGPALEMHVLARKSDSWDDIYAVESDEGEAVLERFQSLSHMENMVSRLPSGPLQDDYIMSPSMSPEPSTKSINHVSVAVGGTFDHLHIGHKLLLTMFAFVLSREASESRSLIVGITGDELLKNKKHAEYLESWKARQNSVHGFLSSIIHYGDTGDENIDTTEIDEPGPNGHAIHVKYPTGLTVKYVEIWDPFGPTITEETISALVLSLETRGGGTAVNDKRGQKGWEAVEVFEVAVIDASEDEHVDEPFQAKLSSTAIRYQLAERGEAIVRL